MLSRRNFIKYVVSAGAGAFLVGRLPAGTAEADIADVPGTLRLAAPWEAIPGGTLDPLAIPKFQTRMLIPPAMPVAGTVKIRGGKNVDCYEIAVRQFQQQILPAGLPPTTVWGYGAVKSGQKRGLLLHNAPSLTIEARHNTPVRDRDS
jgi:spore coat protein A